MLWHMLVFCQCFLCPHPAFCTLFWIKWTKWRINTAFKFSRVLKRCAAYVMISLSSRGFLWPPTSCFTLFTAHRYKHSNRPEALAGVWRWRTNESIDNPVKHLMNNIKRKMINTTNKQTHFLFQILFHQQSAQRFPNSNNFDLSKTRLMFAVL